MLAISADAIPAPLRSVPYNGAIAPVPGVTPSLGAGANCQVFAYALLRHFGFLVAQLRSSELMADTTSTIRVTTDPEPLDILLFNRDAEAFGAHIAVYLGGEQAIHLSKAEGFPAIWSLARFANTARYAARVGVKRPILRVGDS